MKYRLGEAHYTSAGQYLPAGTVIGDGTDYPFSEWSAHGPTADMVPVDDEAKTLFLDTWQMGSDGRPLKSPSGPGFIRK